MKSVALFGGTFNPVHNGHIHICRACQKQMHFDRILFIPTNLPPHKEAPELAPNTDRFRMLELALEGEPAFEPCDIEYHLGGRSYTINTLQTLMKECAEWEFSLILGADMFLTFREWREWERILSLSRIVVGARREEDYPLLLRERKTYGEMEDRIAVVQFPPREISSTQIRDAFRAGEDVSSWLNPKVESYIRKKGLYV